MKAEDKSGELNSVIDGGWSEFGHNNGAESFVIGFVLLVYGSSSKMGGNQQKYHSSGFPLLRNPMAALQN